MKFPKPQHHHFGPSLIVYRDRNHSACNRLMLNTLINKSLVYFPSHCVIWQIEIILVILTYLQQQKCLSDLTLDTENKKVDVSLFGVCNVLV